MLANGFVLVCHWDILQNRVLCIGLVHVKLSLVHDWRCALLLGLLRGGDGLILIRSRTLCRSGAAGFGSLLGFDRIYAPVLVMDAATLVEVS